jgi:hypothetical protein
MALYTFGSGALFAVRGDVANSTPVKFGALQEASVEFAASSKELYGQYQFPLAVARGKAKITGKAKFGQIQGRAFFDLFFGQPASTGQTTLANAEAQSVPASGPYTVQVTNHATFVGDLGVVYAATGLPLVQVASSPAAGQYTVAVGTGTYTFAAADAGAAILVSYQYTVSGSGQQFTLANPLMGVQPSFQIVLETSYQSPSGLKKADLTLFNCVSSKLSLDAKQEDFTIPEMDFEAFANASGNVFTWSFSEAS